MKICIELIDPNESEMDLISELSKIESEKMQDEKNHMEDLLLTKLPGVYQNVLRRESGK